MASLIGNGGTNTTTLTFASVLQFYANNPGNTEVNPADNQFSADIGTINNLIRDDKAYIFPSATGQAGTGVIVPAIPVAQVSTTGGPQAGLLSGGLSQAGILMIPNRGTLKVLPGDVVMIGPTGWPVLLSRVEAVYGKANSFWTFSAAANIN
jgi:hypothetical protein